MPCWDRNTWVVPHRSPVVAVRVVPVSQVVPSEAVESAVLVVPSVITLRSSIAVLGYGCGVPSFFYVSTMQTT